METPFQRTTSLGATPFGSSKSRRHSGPALQRRALARSLRTTKPYRHFTTAHQPSHFHTQFHHRYYTRHSGASPPWSTMPVGSSPQITKTWRHQHETKGGPGAEHHVTALTTTTARAIGNPGYWISSKKCRRGDAVICTSVKHLHRVHRKAIGTSQPYTDQFSQSSKQAVAKSKRETIHIGS